MATPVNKLNRAAISHMGWLATGGAVNATEVEVGRDKIGQEVRVGDVVMIVIDDKMVLASIKRIVRDDWYRSNLDTLERYIYVVERYKSKLKTVEIRRSSDQIFRLPHEVVAAAVLSGRLQ